MRPFEIPFSKVIASFAFSSLCHLATGIALHLVAGVHYGNAELPAVLAIFALLEFFSSALGVLLCCVFRSENVANQILSLVITLFAIMGGLFFRIDGLGIVAEHASNLFAVKWVATALFQLIWDTNTALFMPTAAILIAASAIFIGSSATLFRTEDYV